MSTAAQWIIVGVAIGLALAFMLRRLRSGSKECDGCPLVSTCTKRRRR